VPEQGKVLANGLDGCTRDRRQAPVVEHQPTLTSIASMTRIRPISMNGSTELPARTSSILRRIKFAILWATFTPRRNRHLPSGKTRFGIGAPTDMGVTP
jgi:hypothetical protein